MVLKKLTYEFVKGEFEERGYTLLETEYINAGTKMRCVCSKHGEQSIRYSDIQQGHGCPRCGAESGGNKLRLSYEIVKEVFNSHGYTLLETKYVNAKTKMRYLCPIHGEQSITYSKLKSGEGCPECGHDKQRLSYDFVENIFKSHGYTLISKEYNNSNDKLRYLCPIHGEQSIAYSKLKSGSGCPECDIDRRRLSYEFVNDEFKSRGYVLLSKQYNGANEKLEYLCHIHGKQSIRYADFHNGRGCPRCSDDKMSRERRLSYNVVKKAFNDKGYVLLDDEYINNTTLLRYLCPIHGEQSITYSNLSQGQGCPVCSSSKGEIAIQEYLDNHDIHYIPQYTFDDLVSNGRKLRFDFAVLNEDNEPSLLIEYQGKQHYEPVDFAGKGDRWAIEQFKAGQRRDRIKVKYCEAHNIPLLTIGYNETVEYIMEQGVKCSVAS